MDSKKFNQVFYSLIAILQVILAQVSDLASKDINPSKAIRFAELNPIMKFKLGPLESIYDHFYNSNGYAKSFKNNNRKIQGKITGFENWIHSERRTIGQQENFKWKNYKRNADFEKQKAHINWNQVHRTALTLASKSSKFSGILKLINKTGNRIKQLKILSEFLANVRTELNETEKSLTVDLFEKLLKFLEKNFLGDKSESNTKMADRNTFKEINNQTYNTQYQIENVFIFNRLSEENNSKLKEVHAEVFNELTACKIKELLEKAVSNLNESGILQDDISPIAQSSFWKNQMNLLEKLQKNFLKMFRSQNVTLKHINQMSKIIDFVERYHGTVSNLKTSSVVQDNEDRKNGNVERNKENPGTLQQSSGKHTNKEGNSVDDGFNSFGSEEIN